MLNNNRSNAEPCENHLKSLMETLSAKLFLEGFAGLIISVMDAEIRADGWLNIVQTKHRFLMKQS